jgi:hypothetical protein
VLDEGKIPHSDGEHAGDEQQKNHDPGELAKDAEIYVHARGVSRLVKKRKR